jgi:hypothetical protein
MPTRDSATEIKVLADVAKWHERSEEQRKAFLADLQRIVDALRPIDDAEHVETAGLATEVAESLIRAIERR